MEKLNTKKAQEEVEKLNEEIAYLKSEEKRYNDKAMASTDSFVRKSYYSECNKIYNKIYKKEEKRDSIIAMGISSSEKTSVVKELYTYKTLKSSKTLGSTNYVKIGFSKKLNTYVKVEYTYFSNFMHNVRGCGSLANKKDIDAIHSLSEEEYNQLSNENRVSECYFMGAHEKKVMSPEGKVVEVSQ